MDLTSLKLRIRDGLRPAKVSAAIKSAFEAIKRLYIRAARRWNKPGFKSGLFRPIGWGLFAIFYGLLVGGATVILPPMVSVALVALSAPILFWALPEMPTIPVKTLRRVFFLTVAIELGVPNYYMVQISGFPWLSIRRLAVFALILLTLYSVSVSRNERRTIAKALTDQRWLGICMIGYLFMCFISILFSGEPVQSITVLIDLFLNWYLPFFACLMVIRTERDVLILFKTLAWLSLFVAALGVLDFFTQHNWALEIIPQTMLMKMMEDNPAIADFVKANPFRNGQYRASSIFNVPLSYGEFGAMIAPLGLYFILHARKASEGVFGFFVLIGAMLGLFVSGSRGGSVAFLLSSPLLLGVWVIRYSASHPRSVVGPLFVTISGMGFAALIALIFTWKRLYNIVLGGGDTANSDEGRHEQWMAGMPHIIANPITGHGIGRSGEVVNWHDGTGKLSIDSFALNLIVETGVPGLLLYFGMIVAAAVVLFRIYLKNKDSAAELGAPVACSMIAYGVYRLVLSQRENQTLAFIFLAVAFVIAQVSTQNSAKNAIDGGLRKKGASLQV